MVAPLPLLRPLLYNPSPGIKVISADRNLIIIQVFRLFPGRNVSVVLGAIGLAETLSFAALGVMNCLIFSDESSNTFLILFLTLATCSLISVPVTAGVSSTKNSLEQTEETK